MVREGAKIIFLINDDRYRRFFLILTYNIIRHQVVQLNLSLSHNNLIILFFRSYFFKEREIMGVDGTTVPVEG